MRLKQLIEGFDFIDANNVGQLLTEIKQSAQMSLETSTPKLLNSLSITCLAKGEQPPQPVEALVDSLSAAIVVQPADTASCWCHLWSIETRTNHGAVWQRRHHCAAGIVSKVWLQNQYRWVLWRLTYRFAWFTWQRTATRLRRPLTQHRRSSCHQQKQLSAYKLVQFHRCRCKTVRLRFYHALRNTGYVYAQQFWLGAHIGFYVNSSHLRR